MNGLKLQTVVSNVALTPAEDVIFSATLPRFVPEPSKRGIPHFCAFTLICSWRLSSNSTGIFFSRYA